jgi:hypothetical protein
VQPAPVGAVGSVGYDTTAIGRWDVVPYQTVTGDFNIGVVAFDIAGIDHVDFSLNGGAWTPVTAMAMNPTTNTWEYTATIHTADVPDGPMEVRAIVWPRAGTPRVLGGAMPTGYSNGQFSLFLTSNGHGTIAPPSVYVRASGNDSNNGSTTSPVRTIARAAAILGSNANGATIYVGEGDFASIGGSASATTRWLNLVGEPGTNPANVRIIGPSAGSGLYGVAMLHVKNMTIVLPAWVNGQTNYAVFETTTPSSRLWMENCTIQNVNLDRHVRVAPLCNGSDMFATDTIFREVDGGPYGSVVARNVQVLGMINAGFSNSSLVVNCKVDNIEFYGGYHPDVYQLYRPGQAVDNIIIYGLRATNCDSQGLNIGASASVSNMAMVNVLIQKTGASSMASQMGTGFNHMLLWDSTLLQGITWYGCTNLANVSFRNNVFTGFWYYDWNTRDAGIAALQGALGPHSSQNHYVAPLQNGPFALGSAYTTGDPMLVDAANGNFRPAAASPIRGRVLIPLVPADAAGVVVPTPGALGAYQP